MKPPSARFLVSLAIVSVGAALFAILFRSTLAWVYQTLFRAEHVVDAVTGLPVWARFALPVAGAAIAGLLSRVLAAPTQNVSNVMEAIALGNVHLSLRATVCRVAVSWTAIAGGLSIGREGPLIEFGGALGAAVGRRAATSLTATRVLVAAGTAAGFAAAYNTPFAAALFVLETMAGIAAPELLLPVMGGTVLATTVTRSVVGSGPIYGERAFGAGSFLELFLVALLGVVAALAAYAFKSVLAFGERWFEDHPMPQPLRAMTGGLLVGAIAMWLPSVVGNGYEPLNHMLDAPMTLGAVALLAGAKVAATSASVASGIPGGIFTPMLLTGASVGSGLALILGDAGSVPTIAGSYALVGMAATTAASIHAPLTAAVMVFELSGDYAIVVPLMLATVVATTVSRALGSESVYETELRRRGLAWDMTLEGRQMREPE